MLKKILPVGTDNFEKIRTEDFYYIDKTGLIKELLENRGEVNLFTRPRRFGKSMNMSMLRYFFEIGTNPSLFDGLEISKYATLCEMYMGHYPVVSVTLKGIEGKNYTAARSMAVTMINEEARRLYFLKESEKLSQEEKALFTQLLGRNLDDDLLSSSLKILTELLKKHYGKKVILLIDEYDVPLAKANELGYYDDMIYLIRSMFNQALKTNASLYFAVMTGCLRIARESIFTGLNNLLVLSITDLQFDEYFGFSDQEVRDALECYGLTERYEDIQEWYDGYQFGNVKVYNPWDIIRCIYDLKANPKARMKNYWSNTSGNDLVRHFVKMAGAGQTKTEIEALLAGEVVIKDIKEDLTYNCLYDSIDNIWSVLLMTGYLTIQGEVGEKSYKLAIPNREIRNIFTEQIMDLFKENVKNDGEKLKYFCDAIENGDAAKVEILFSAYLKDTIGIRDTFVHKDRKENFYHGILLGILGFRDGWYLKSNQESGDGFPDILIEIESREIGVIIEVKYADKAKYSDALAEAFDQITENNYVEKLKDDGFFTIYKYGIACFKKRCRVKMEKVEIHPED